MSNKLSETNIRKTKRRDHKPRVAYLTNQLLDWNTREPRFGGGERYCLTLGTLLRQLGFDVTFYQAAHERFEGDYYGFNVISIPISEHFSEFHPGVCNDFYELSASYDHVIYNLPMYASGRIRDDAILLCHSVWFDHNNSAAPIAFRSPEWFTHLYKAFSRPRKIVSVDTNVINVIRALWPELTDRITYLPNWVDTDLFHPPEQRDPNQITILFPRRAEFTRGSRLLGPVLEMIPHDCRIRWVGDGEPEDTEIIEAVARRDPRLEFYAASFEQMPRFYQEADICVIPAVASEGTCLAALEGLASGCAVVATNVGGLANLIQPELNGLLVDPQPEQIAAAVDRLIENAEERARYQQAGLRTAANFSLSIWQQRWVELLTDLEWIAPTARPDLTLSTRSNGAATPAHHNAQVKASYQDQQTDIARLRVDSALYDVICFSVGEWDSGERVSQRIVHEFADHGHRVFLVGTANTLLADGKRYDLEPLRDKVWGVRVASPNANVVESLEAMRNEFDITRAVSVVQSTVWERPAVIAREHFGWGLVYDCRDGQNSSSGAQSDETLLEGAERLARLADVVLVPSKRMRDKLSPSNSNTILMNKPRIDQIKEAIDRAQLKTNMVDVIRMLAAESLQDETSDSNDNGTLRRLQQIALRLSSSLAEREQAVQAIKGRLAERDRTATALTTELQVVEKIVTARDEAIAWLNEELANSRKENVTFAEALSPLVTGYRRLAEVEARLAEVQARAAELVTRLADRDSEVQLLLAQLTETQRNNQSLSAQLSDMQRANELLATNLAMQRERAGGAERALESRETELAQVLRQLTEVKQENASRAVENDKQKRKADELAQNLSDKVRAVDYRTAQLEEREKIIEGRDEAISWLKTSLAEAHRKGERLQGSNAILSQQLAKKENARQALAGRLAETEAELGKIVNSIGWQILSRYGRVKYRYLLPVYRALGLMRAEAGTPELAQLPPVEPSSAPQSEEPSASQGADEEPELQRFLAEMAKPSDETGDREPAQAFKPDFYESLTLLPHLEQEQIEAILDKEPPAAPSRRLDVICFSIIDWEFRYQRPQQIMSQFAAHGHRVFYVSTTRFLSSDASPRVLVKQIKENVYEVQLASARMPDVYGEVIEGANKQTLLDALEELRSTYQINDAIGYVMIASWGAVALEAKRVWGWRTIYDCMDEWENFPGIKRELLDTELELVRQSDLLVVTAQLLYNKWEKYGRATVLARNAVDWDFYTEQYRPNTLLTDIKHPVIGYYGAIADWFDVELLSEAARQRPQYTFVVLGGIFDVDVSSLSALPNVHLLGQQPYETMPRYLFHFDVCMIPFKINPITEATDPVKVYEYLSAGKPVVSVNLPELESLREYVYIAKDRDDFVVQLDKAVLEDDSEMVTRRRRFAQGNTWENRYLQIEAGLAEVVPRASVIIVTYHNLALNKLCLESLIRNTEYPNYEIIVVDNDSKDGTPAYLRYMAAQYPSISVILNQTNHGFARANNQGIARSNGEYIVLLNNDTVVPPGWLSRLVRHLENDSVGMVGPVTNFVGNEAKIEIDYQTWREMENFAARHIWEHDRKAADIYMLAMFCVAFRRETCDEIGPLDEQFGVGMFEDDDYAQRMKAKGYRVMCAADVFVHHFGQAAFKKLIENGSYNPLFDENRSYYETKWNVTWTPHKHARLKFEQVTHAPFDTQAAEKKR